MTYLSDLGKSLNQKQRDKCLAFARKLHRIFIKQELPQDMYAMLEKCPGRKHYTMKEKK